MYFDNNYKWRTILFVQFYKIHREQALFVYFPLTGDRELCIIAVSYTHLTLPTIA